MECSCSVQNQQFHTRWDISLKNGPLLQPVTHREPRTASRLAGDYTTDCTQADRQADCARLSILDDEGRVQLAHQLAMGFGIRPSRFLVLATWYGSCFGGRLACLRSASESTRILTGGCSPVPSEHYVIARGHRRLHQEFWTAVVACALGTPCCSLSLCDDHSPRWYSLHRYRTTTP